LDNSILTMKRVNLFPKKTRMSTIYNRQQSRLPKQERRYFALFVFIITSIKLVVHTIEDFNNELYPRHDNIVRLAIRVGFHIAFNLTLWMTLRARNLQQYSRAAIFEILLVLFSAGRILTKYATSAAGIFYESTNDLTEYQNLFSSLGSDVLFSIILTSSILSKTYHILLYLVLTFGGYIALIIVLDKWVIAIGTILQGFIVLGFFVYQEKIKWASFQKRYKLKVTDVLFKSVLSSLPESILVITESGNIEYQNNYMKKMFEYDIVEGFQKFASSFSTLKLRDCIEETKFKLISSANFFPDRNARYTKRFQPISMATEAIFKKSAAAVQSFEELVAFFKDSLMIWKSFSNFTLVFDAKYTHPDSGEVLSIEMKVFILTEGEEVQLALIFRDTTDRDRIAALESEKEAYKNNIIASFSHELRTPLNGNMGLLEQALSLPETPESLKINYLEPALTSSKLLLYIISDILDYSQFLSKDFLLNIQKSSLAETISRCLTLFRNRIHQKGLKLEVDIDPEGHLGFFTDHQRLSQVLINLLSNALKFTFEGSIRIELIRDCKESYTLKVIDTGLGMDEDTQNRLKRNLELRKIVESKIGMETAGFGLGLFMTNVFCQYITPEAEPGLHFISEKGKGSEFYFALKNFALEYDSADLRTADKKENINILSSCVSILTENEDSNIIKSAISSYQTQGFKNKLSKYQILSRDSKSNIPTVPNSEDSVALIVDDEVFNVLVLERYCKSIGLKTEKAYNGKEALTRVQEIYQRKQKVAMVFMDINMPIMDGYQTTCALREMAQKEEIDDVLIVGVTAYVSKDKIDKCYDCGMNEVINKPLSQEVFMKVARKYGLV